MGSRMGTAIFLRSKWAPLRQKESRTYAQFLNTSSTNSAQAPIRPGASTAKPGAQGQNLCQHWPWPGRCLPEPTTSTYPHRLLRANGDQWISEQAGVQPSAEVCFIPFKILALQQLFKLSDEELEFHQANHRRSCEEFVGLDGKNSSPNATTVAVFQDLLSLGGFESLIHEKGARNRPLREPMLLSTLCHCRLHGRLFLSMDIA